MTKKLFLGEIVVLAAIQAFIVQSFAQTGTQRPAFSRPNRYSQSYGQMVTWHKKKVNGVDSLYSRGATVAKIAGTADTIYSDCFYNHGRNSVQFLFEPDATPNLFTVYVEVLTANAGDDPITSLPDSIFKTKWWLKRGTGGGENVISTSKDSITVAGLTGPIELYLGSDEWFKFLIYSSKRSNHDVNNVRAYLNRQEK